MKATNQSRWRWVVLWLVLLLAVFTMGLNCLDLGGKTVRWRPRPTTTHTFGLNMDEGTYSGLTITVAQSLGGITSTSFSRTTGKEVCLPAVGVETDWDWLMSAQQSTDGEFAVSWASGVGSFYTGLSAATSCGDEHGLRYDSVQTWNNADGDLDNDGKENHGLCVDFIVVPPSLEEQPVPCIVQ